MNIEDARARWAGALPPSVGVTADQLAHLQLWAERKVEVRRCWVFGSRAGSNHRGRTFQPDSDIDIALELMCSPDDEEYIRLTYRAWDGWVKELRAFLPYRVHLVEVREERPVTEAIAAGHGVLLIFDRGQAQM